MFISGGIDKEYMEYLLAKKIIQQLKELNLYVIKLKNLCKIAK